MVAINIWLTVQVFLRDLRSLIEQKKTHQNTLTEKECSMYKYYLANIKRVVWVKKFPKLPPVVVVHNI